tara:strand:- start:2859 stop:3323 length:465 start_codon:yes stop_codon:yes gene_type:complete
LVTALVADPSPASRRAARHLLERLGFGVAEASCPADALAFVSGTAPDLVLVDGGLEGPDGGLLMEAIRNLPAARDICLFHVAAEALPASIRRAIDAGADDYLVKPFDEALLGFKLAQARTRGRFGAGRARLRIVGEGPDAERASWRFGLFGKAV